MTLLAFRSHEECRFSVLSCRPTEQLYIRHLLVYCPMHSRCSTARSIGTNIVKHRMSQLNFFRGLRLYHTFLRRFPLSHRRHVRGCSTCGAIVGILLSHMVGTRDQLSDFS